MKIVVRPLKAETEFDDVVAVVVVAAAVVVDNMNSEPEGVDNQSAASTAFDANMALAYEVHHLEPGKKDLLDVI